MFLLAGFFLFPSIIFAQSIPVYITQQGYPAALTIEALDRFLDCQVAKDTVCMAKLVTSGEVILLKGAIEVYRVESKMFSGLVRIRPKGETFAFWTLIEAIKQKD
jgi:hypothetical protein